MNCVKNPTGVRYCHKYLTSTECEICDPGMIVVEGECSILPLEEKIEHCEFYKSINDVIQCQDCYDGFFLND